MYNISNIGNDCCGCGNCYHVCHKKAIELNENTEGFIYPLVSDSCINCGACLNVCPQLSSLNERLNQICLIAITKNSKILKNASSGGVFGTIAQYFLSKENAYVCTASFVEGEVKHIITRNTDDLSKCQGSKYVQSNLGDCFLKIKDILKNPINKVLFCGTPCQVAALYSFLKKHPVNLYTIDLICHGVPSPFFLKKNIKHYCYSLKNLENIRFRWRNPNKNKGSSGYFLLIEKKNSTRLYSSNYDPYFASFMRGESFRESCYKCKYSNLKRIGNITIGDCDSAKLYSSFHRGESNSTVILNDEQGKKLWDNINNLFDYDFIDLIKEAEYNHQLSHSVSRPLVRDHIYSDVNKMGFFQMKKKYAPPISIRQKILSLVQTYFPFIYKIILERTL